MTKENNSGYIPQITGVRAVAAYMVFFHHFPILAAPALVLQIFKEFHTGVGLFFVLSGFLIYQRYFTSVRMDKTWWLTYLRNRVARIYPMYFLLTIAGFASRFIRHGEFQPEVIFLNLTFLRGFFFDYLFTGIPQGWTLTVEECFYFSAPVIFLAIRRWNMLVPLGIIYCTGFLLYLIGDAIQFKQFFSPAFFVIYYTFFGRCFEFFCGMWLARFLMRHQEAGTMPQTRFVTWFGVVGAMASIYGMSTFQSTPGLYMGVGLFHPIGGILNNLVLPICYAMIYYGLIVEQSWLRKFLATDFMVLLGKSSYIFYLIHMGLTQAIVSRVLPHEHTTLGVITQFIALNIISIALFTFVEEPLNKWIRRVWQPA
jgi:peptidoglycan/LPS O-acetylase OafA/YrhL